ncbi:uncharacterized protein LOC128226405 [Mya arenaria]|uniref:uncharacterized protein LOC128226405 n=1 Tax=Mya arenaria TaxID=6604 RepID=UPI0022E801B3|nr:uncharacterized protein LOC128226405 [Mya arenaria]
MYHEYKKPASFFKEIRGLPVMQAAGELYTSSKNSSRILSTGLAIVEYGISSVAGKFDTDSVIAHRVDELAGESVCRLKEKYPALQEPPEELKSQAQLTARTAVRWVMKTVPGRLLMGGLDLAIDAGEGVMRQLLPRDKSPRKLPGTRAAVKRQPLKSEPKYASEDSGACEGDGSARTSDKALQTRVVRRPQPRGLRGKALEVIEFLVSRLKYVRRYVGGKRRRPARVGMSPEKEREIRNRRRISPRKKTPTSLIGRLTSKLLGYKASRFVDLGKGTGGLGEAERKRKHDDIVSDPGSASEEDLHNFDFNNYNSDDDPDYQPSATGESDTSVSQDLSESDIEAEVVEHGPGLLQLKDKQPGILLASQPSKAQPEDDICLKPQWQKQ